MRTKTRHGKRLKDKSRRIKHKIQGGVLGEQMIYRNVVRGVAYARPNEDRVLTKDDFNNSFVAVRRINNIPVYTLKYTNANNVRNIQIDFAIAGYRPGEDVPPSFTLNPTPNGDPVPDATNGGNLFSSYTPEEDPDPAIRPPQESKDIYKTMYACKKNRFKSPIVGISTIQSNNQLGNELKNVAWFYQHATQHAWGLLTNNHHIYSTFCALSQINCIMHSDKNVNETIDSILRGHSDRLQGNDGPRYYYNFRVNPSENDYIIRGNPVNIDDEKTRDKVDCILSGAISYLYEWHIKGSILNLALGKKTYRNSKNKNENREFWSLHHSRFSSSQLDCTYVDKKYNPKIAAKPAESSDLLTNSDSPQPEQEQPQTQPEQTQPQKSQTQTPQQSQTQTPQQSQNKGQLLTVNGTKLKLKNRKRLIRDELGRLQPRTPIAKSNLNIRKNVTTRNNSTQKLGVSNLKRTTSLY